MSRYVLKIELIPGQAMANSEWLPPVVDGEIVCDSVSLAVIMTCLGNPMTVAEAEAEIIKLPHTVDNYEVIENRITNNTNNDLIGLP